jgi:hypothetical protein
MGKVIAEISASLDGFIAGPNRTLEEPLGVGGEKLHEWAVRLKTFREMHGNEGGGETGADDELVAESWRATGAIVMGRRTNEVEDRDRSGIYGREWNGPLFVLTLEKLSVVESGQLTDLMFRVLR